MDGQSGSIQEPKPARFPHRNKAELSVNRRMIQWRVEHIRWSMAPKQIMGLLSALLLIVAMDCGTARATTPKHHTSHKHAAHKRTGKHETVTVTAKRAPQPSLAIITKPPTDAPDFDYRDRIAEAQALAQNAPVQPGDMEMVGNQLAHYTWVLVLGQKTGPLTVLRMDESGRNPRTLYPTQPC